MIKPLLLSLTMIPAPVFAQDYQPQTRQAVSQKEILEEVKRAAEEAKKRQLRGVEEVTYEDVLADPDNIELNYRYAQTEIQKGNLKGAAATLERILMVNAELPRVRLLYAVILFRLDNLDDAQRELDILRPQKMPETLRAELESYVAQIRRRRRKTQVSLSLGAGFDVDDNKNSAAAKGKNLFGDTEVTLDAASTRKIDTAKTMNAGLSIVHDSGFQAGHQIFGSLSYYRSEQTQIKTLNLQNYGVETGAVLKTPWVQLTPSFEVNHLRLAQTTYLRSRGPKLRLERKLGRLSLSAEASYARQVYNRTRVVPTGDERTGDKIEGGAGLSAMLTPNMNASLRYLYAHTGAAQKYNAFRRDSGTLSHSWLLGKGQFILSSLTASADRYEQPELAVSRKKRRDHSYRARGTYGVPLGILAKPLEDMVFTVSYEYFQSLSNIINYAYTNNKISSMLTYKWEL